MWASATHLGILLRTSIPHFTTADNDDFIVATFSVTDFSTPSLLKGVGLNTISNEIPCGIHYMEESDTTLLAIGSDSKWFVTRIDVSVVAWSKSTPFGPYTYAAMAVDEGSGLVYFTVDYSAEDILLC